MSRLAGYLGSVVFLLACAAAVPAQSVTATPNGGPLSEVDVLGLVSMTDIPEDQRIAAVDDACRSFTVDAAAEELFREAGASIAMINGIRSSCAIISNKYDFKTVKRWPEQKTDLCDLSYVQAGYLVALLTPSACYSFGEHIPSDRLVASADAVFARQGADGGIAVHADSSTIYVLVVNQTGSTAVHVYDVTIAEWRTPIIAPADMVSLNTTVGAVNRLGVEIDDHSVVFTVNGIVLHQIFTKRPTNRHIAFTVHREAMVFANLEMVSHFESRSP